MKKKNKESATSATKTNGNGLALAETKKLFSKAKEENKDDLYYDAMECLGNKKSPTTKVGPGASVALVRDGFGRQHAVLGR